MKVLWQVWTHSNGVEINSISKDREQLDVTIAEIGPKPSCDDEDESSISKETAVPEGEAQEVDIPANSALAEVVLKNTVFLHDDEMDPIYHSLRDDP